MRCSPDAPPLMLSRWEPATLPLILGLLAKNLAGIPHFAAFPVRSTGKETLGAATAQEITR